MDLNVYARVLWRFKFLVAFGFILAVALAFLAVARVSFMGGHLTVSYRKPEIWQSQASLLITQQGFPYGRSASTTTATQFSGLVGLYVKFVNSDAVQSKLHLSPTEAVRGQTVVDSSIFGSSTPLPILGIVGLAATPRHAERVADRAAAVFKHYIDEQQQAAAIPDGQRIVLQEMNAASPAGLLQGHKKTLPILAFMTVMIATLGLAFLLENMRPQARIRAAEEEGPEPELLQKSA